MINERLVNYQSSGKDAILFLCINYALAFAFIIPVIYLLADSLILLILLYIISAISTYFTYFYNIEIDQNMVAAFFESNYQEITGVLSLKMLAFVLLAILLAFLTKKLSNKFNYKTSNTLRIKFICSVFVLSALIGDSEGITNFLPYNLIRYSSDYFGEKFIFKTKRIAIEENYNVEIDSNAKDLNIILIIGESARSDHFSLNNYQRETNPLLKKEQNLIFYPNTEACFPLTRVALPCMLTRATKNDRSKSLTEKSFISIFKKAGFNSLWVGTQGSRSVIDGPYIDLAKEADKLLLPGAEADFSNGHDEILIKYAENYLQQNKDKANLLILHTLGSHFHYEDRYPKKFQKFKPICFKKEFFSDMRHCSKEEIINSYDNSILYTDYIISKVIDLVKDKNAIVIYTSDHGESLGENNRYLHGAFGVKEQMSTEMIFWLSDKYIKNFPSNYLHLLTKKNDKISHDYLFYTMLGCGGVKSDINENRLNLCNN